MAANKQTEGLFIPTKDETEIYQTAHIGGKNFELLPGYCHLREIEEKSFSNHRIREFCIDISIYKKVCDGIDASDGSTICIEVYSH